MWTKPYIDEARYCLTLRIFNVAEIEEDLQQSSLPHVSQSKMNTAHHSIVEPLLNTLRSLYLEVQDEGKHGNMHKIKSCLVVFCHLPIFSLCAAINLILVLKDYDVRPVLLSGLVALLRPAEGVQQDQNVEGS